VSYGSGSIGSVGVTPPNRVKDSESGGWITTIRTTECTRLGYVRIGEKRCGGLTGRRSFYIPLISSDWDGEAICLDISYLHGRVSSEGGVDWGLTLDEKSKAWRRTRTND
jgi:hypothetical protein